MLIVGPVCFADPVFLVETNSSLIKAEQFVVRNSIRKSPGNESRNESIYESLSFRGSSQFVVLGFGFTKVDTKVENFCRAERCVAALSVAMTSASLLSLLTMPCTTSSYLRSLSSCRSIGVSSDRPLRDTMRAGTRRFCRVLRRSRGILGP